MPTSPSPSCSFCATDTTACPPDAQAFSTASMGLLPSPGTMAMSPARSPCSFSEKLQVAPIDPTSATPGSTWISSHTPRTARSTISGTVRAMSLPNGD